MNLPSSRKLVPLVCFAVLGVGNLCKAQNVAPASVGSQPTPEVEQKAQSSPNAATAPITNTATEIAKPQAQPAAAPPDAAPQADIPKDPSVRTKKAYIIGPLDVLGIKVWNQGQISGPVDVQPDGTISLPLVGAVKAEGLTTIELKDVLTRRLGEVALTSPEVDVQLLKNNSKRFSVYGPGVQRGGTFPLIETTSVADALQLTGITEFAKSNKIEIRRGKEVLHFNYKDYVKGKNMDKNINIELQPGDIVIVPQ